MAAYFERGRGYPRSRRFHRTRALAFPAFLALVLVAVAVFAVLTILHSGLTG